MANFKTMNYTSYSFAIRLLMVVGLAALATGCESVSNPLPRSSSAQLQKVATTLVPALQTHDPKVLVTPSVNLRQGQQVRVSVTGFGVGGKFFLSECAGSADANSSGCGIQLAAQPFGVTNSSGAGTVIFTLTSSASTTPYNDTDIQTCVNQCVLVATVGSGGGFAYASLHFAQN
ncbi:MAG: neocarzinostatin apoprotein domain-containing protein [Actinobacteria bacterium]|nr:neocarzinostatin apoprotein domain-containing protein [Actinomycetota bacterium]